MASSLTLKEILQSGVSPADIPAAAPPPGVIPDFIHPPSQAYITIITVVVCLTLMASSVALRIANGLLVTRLRWNDYICILGFMGTVVFSSTVASLLRFGYGIHQWDLKLDRLGQDSFRNIRILFMVYGPMIILIKLSIFLLYLHIFAINRRTRGLIYGGIIVVLVGNITTTTLFGVFCTPQDGDNWAETYGSPRCYQRSSDAALSVGLLNVITDFYILWIPLPLVWHLNLPTRKKIGLVLVFLQGLLACAASLTSVIFRFKYRSTVDYTAKDMQILCTMVIEINIGLFCSCMPACASLFRHYSRSLRISTPLRSFRPWLHPRSGRRLRSESTEDITYEKGTFSNDRHGSSGRSQEDTSMELRDLSTMTENDPISSEI